MSRRHHGRSRHGRNGGPDAPRTPRTENRPEGRPEAAARPDPITPVPEALVGPGPAAIPAPAAVPEPRRPPSGPEAPAPGTAGEVNGGLPRAGCTAPQLRRFIKSRPYVPMHELRRRFGINGAEDDVTPLPIDDARIYVGLPERECELLGELVRGGEVGYELSLDPQTPIVVGVYPMRPVPRA